MTFHNVPDFTPFTKMSVGLNSLFDDLVSNVNNAGDNYPPYNIIRDNDNFSIVFAIAGFNMDEINITLEYNKLTITGSKDREMDGLVRDENYLYRGLSFRNFSKTFTLGDHIEVDSASLNNGLLTINLVKDIPEELQPRRIEIQSTEAPLLEES